MPQAGLAGILEIDKHNSWTLDFGFRKHVRASLQTYPLEVKPLSATSCRVIVRDVTSLTIAASFELPTTSANTLNADLQERDAQIEKVRSDAVAREAEAQREADLRGARLAAGEWWVGMPEHPVLIGCHFSGARKKDERGTLKATATGLDYKAVLGSKVNIPWNVIKDIEVSTQSTKRVTAGRVLAVGIFALAAKKTETYTYVHISDQNTVWSFASKTSQARVMDAMTPILTRFNARMSNVPETDASTVAAGPVPGIADELAKLAGLVGSGVLTQEEFDAQKAKLLGT